MPVSAFLLMELNQKTISSLSHASQRSCLIVSVKWGWHGSVLPRAAVELAPALHTTIKYRHFTKMSLVNSSSGSYIFTNNITIIIKQYDEHK